MSAITKARWALSITRPGIPARIFCGLSEVAVVNDHDAARQIVEAHNAGLDRAPLRPDQEHRRFEHSVPPPCPPYKPARVDNGIVDYDANPGETSFQSRVHPWLMECFGEMIAGDREERNHRFLEEALELVQSLGCTADSSHKLVDYVFGREIGDPDQEVGGTMVTLAALCLANQLDMQDAGNRELARIMQPEIVAKIRAKQSSKPQFGPLPGVYPERASAGVANPGELLPDGPALPAIPDDLIAAAADARPPHNCERDGHLPIGWTGTVYCELCWKVIGTEEPLAEGHADELAKLRERVQELELTTANAAHDIDNIAHILQVAPDLAKICQGIAKRLRDGEGR